MKQRVKFNTGIPPDVKQRYLTFISQQNRTCNNLLIRNKVNNVFIFIKKRNLSLSYTKSILRKLLFLILDKHAG